MLGFDSAPIENLARNAENLLRQPVQLKDQVKWAVIRAFTRPNAIKNQYAALAEHMLDATEQEGAHKLDTVYSNWIESNRFGWNLASIRDPATAIFMGNALLDAAYFRKMLGSMQAKSAQRRLHVLRINSRQAKIADEQIQRYLDSANPGLFNPHDMQPMRWEATKRMLYAPGVGNSGWRPEVKL